MISHTHIANTHIEFDALQLGLIVLDQQGRIQYLNAAAQALLRAPQSHAHDLPLTQWFEADETLKQIIRHIEMGSDSVYRCVLRMIRQGDGSELDNALSIYVALSPLPNANEHTAGYMLECFDLGAYEQVQQDTQLRAHTQSHQLLMRQLAHEIKNPLGGIRGATQLLQDELETLQPELTEYTEMILGQVDRLKNLVDQYLVPYRQGMAQAQMINIHKVCDEAFRLALIEFGEDRIEWLRDYDVSIPPVRAVADYVEQLLLNIIQNAAQAVLSISKRERGDKPKVTLRTRIARHCLVNQVKHAMMLEISVLDNGSGIPDEIADTLFLPLVTQREGGTGLGLSVAMQIAQQHGGTIEVVNRPQRPYVTQMRVLLPLQS